MSGGGDRPVSEALRGGSGNVVAVLDFFTMKVLLSK